MAQCTSGETCSLFDPYTDGHAPGWGAGVIEDNVRYQAVDALVISYLDYSILDIHMLLLPNEKLAFRYALELPSIHTSQSEEKWGGISSKSLAIAWDGTWPANKRFKIWWQRLVDQVAYDAAGGSYDKYTMIAAQPGTAWCEAVVTFNKPLPADPGHLIFHFYPNGKIDTDISVQKRGLEADLVNAAEVPRFTKRNRAQLATLKNAPCLKQIANPYYGTRRPLDQH